MNRSGFLKSLATLVAAPSIISGVADKPLTPLEPPAKEVIQNLPHNILRIYTPEAGNCRVGDYICSDCDSRAIISTVNLDAGYIDARPLVYCQYYFKDPNCFYRAASLYQKTSI